MGYDDYGDVGDCTVDHRSFWKMMRQRYGPTHEEEEEEEDEWTKDFITGFWRGFWLGILWELGGKYIIMILIIIICLVMIKACGMS